MKLNELKPYVALDKAFFKIKPNRSEIEVFKTNHSINTECREYLFSFLNSNLFKYCFEENFPEFQENTRELNKVIFEQIPVKNISNEKQKPFIDLFDRILEIKNDNPEIDAADLENEIDQLVYKLYDLTDEEIKVVEENVG